MISYTMVSLFCNEDISLIENYEQAAADIMQTWHCHHRLEIQDEIILSKNELIRQNLYFNRPASELIFLTKSEHMQLHAKNRSKQTRKLIADSKIGKTLSKEAKQKISKSLEGNTRMKGKRLSEEAKQKLRDFWKNHPEYNEERKRKIAESQKGKHFSDEHKRKLSESNKRARYIKRSEK